MKKVITVAAATAVAALGSVLLAPSAWAMVAPPEPGSNDSGTGTTSTTLAGIATWQVVAIVLVAVAIGAVGTYLAQRTHRHAENRSVSMA